MGIFDTLTSITAEQWRLILGIAAPTIGISVWAGHAVGRAKSWNDRRQDRDRDNVNVVSFILQETREGRTIFDVETDDKLPRLQEVFCNPQLENLVRAALPRHAAGDRLFSPGKMHYLAMERAGYFLSGPSSDATYAAMAHREEEIHEDLIAYKLTTAVGEDGIKMPHLFQASIADLQRLRDPKVVKRLVPRRQVHARYIPLAEQMAIEQASSAQTFHEYSDEIAAGRVAIVWTTLIRTQRSLTVNEVRKIVDQTMRAVQRSA